MADVKVTVTSEHVLDLELVRPVLEQLGLDPNHVSSIALTPAVWAAVVVMLDDQGRPIVTEAGVAEQLVHGRVIA